MEKFELYSTCATVTWCGRLIALNNLTRVYVEVDRDKAEISIREPGKDFITLAEIELNKDFESVALKDAKRILDFIGEHNSVLLDGYDLDGLAATFEELLRRAGLLA